jgi:hypothetical protein
MLFKICVQRNNILIISQGTYDWRQGDAGSSNPDSLANIYGAFIGEVGPSTLFSHPSDGPISDFPMGVRRYYILAAILGLPFILGHCEESFGAKT